MGRTDAKTAETEARTEGTHDRPLRLAGGDDLGLDEGLVLPGMVSLPSVSSGLEEGAPEGPPPTILRSIR
jgi:hypothetical protein